MSQEHIIKISFNDATLPFYHRNYDETTKLVSFDKGLIASGVLKVDKVRNKKLNENGEIITICGNRAVLNPETILTNDPRETKYTINGEDKTRDIISGYDKKDDFEQYLAKTYPYAKYETIEKYSDARFPFRLEPIVNMLSVMCGETPVSTFHKNPLKHGITLNPELITTVCNGYIKLFTPFCYTKINKDGRETVQFITETKKYDKSYPSNKKKTIPTVSWFGLRYRFINKPEVYQEIISILQKYTGTNNIENNFVEVCDAINYIHTNKSNWDNFIKEEIIKKYNLTPLLPDKDRTFYRPTCINRFGAVSEGSSPVKVINLSGLFLFKLDDRWYQKLLTGVKNATYLDGGLALLEKWTDYGVNSYSVDFLSEDEIICNGFVNLNDVFNKKVLL